MGCWKFQHFWLARSGKVGVDAEASIIPPLRRAWLVGSGSLGSVRLPHLPTGQFERRLSYGFGMAEKCRGKSHLSLWTHNPNHNASAASICFKSGSRNCPSGFLTRLAVAEAMARFANEGWISPASRQN